MALFPSGKTKLRGCNRTRETHDFAVWKRHTPLHHAIFHAFDREEEHWYEFQVGGKGPMDPKARRYVLRSAMEIPIRGSPKPAGDVARTTIDSLGLNVGEAFGYWFDFGDDWWHQINVAAIGKERRRGKLPRVVKRIGASPPQYVDPRKRL
jgi:hypothetical protein